MGEIGGINWIFRDEIVQSCPSFKVNVLHVLHVSEECLMGICERLFSIEMPRLCNSLPQETLIASLDIFENWNEEIFIPADI